MADNQPQVDPSIASAIAAAMAAVSPKVTYDVADLLDRMGTRIDAGFADMKALMAGKADKADLSRIEARLDEHGKEIGRIKDQLREDEAAETAVAKQRQAWADWRKWAVGIAALVVASQPWNWHIG